MSPRNTAAPHLSTQSATAQRGSVELRKVTKRFERRGKGGYQTLKSQLLRLFGRADFQHRTQQVQVLRDVTLSIAPGKAVGIIGRNGSGKSTLLKLISGIYRADCGEVLVQGRLSALIELGAGFHPDFTGRENLYLGGVVFGLTRREIEARLNDIVRFAELEEVIDEPVRTYSSGMYMRLGFSLAVHSDPDIMLVDEVLAVGDARFVAKCHDTIHDLKRRGKTMIMVSHDLEAVKRWCDEVVWLEQGAVRERGEASYVIDRYLRLLEGEEERELATARTADRLQGENSRWGDRRVEISGVGLFDSGGASRWVLHEGETLQLDVRYVIHEVVDELVFGVGILRSDGMLIHGTNTELEGIAVPVPQPGVAYPVQGCCRFILPSIELLPSSYFIDVAVHRADGVAYDYHHRLYQFAVRGQAKQQGVFNPPHHWEFSADYAADFRICGMGVNNAA